MKKNINKHDRLELGTTVICKCYNVPATVEAYGVYDGPLRDYQGQLTYIVKYWEPQTHLDGTTTNTDAFLPEAVAPYLKDLNLQNGTVITMMERRTYTRHYIDFIKQRTEIGCIAKIGINNARVEVNTAYRDKKGNPVSYCVCWYDDGDLKECENGIRLHDAAKYMADFYLFTEAGLTLDEILYNYVSLPF